MNDFIFNSDRHQRSENGQRCGDEQICNRSIEVKRNVLGCKGYNLPHGYGYIVYGYNLDTKTPEGTYKAQFAPKPMIIVSETAEKVELRGYTVQAMTPFGYIDFDLSDYGLTIYYKDGIVQHCVLHMFDRNIEIDYTSDNSKNSSQTTTYEVGLVTPQELFKRTFKFQATRYEEWMNGICLSKGNFELIIRATAYEDRITFTLSRETPCQVDTRTTYYYEGSDILEDGRIQYVNIFGLMNDIPTAVICHIFIKHQKVHCIRFAMKAPHEGFRIVEFYGQMTI